MKTKRSHCKLITALLGAFLILTFSSSAQSPGIECGFTDFDKYKAPAIKGIKIDQGEAVEEASSPNNKYQVIAHPTDDGKVSISVQQNSVEILQGIYNAGGWGFSPDEDKFVIHGSDHHGFHWCWLFNLNPDPSVTGEEAIGEMVISPTDVSSSRIGFSPHGKYLVYGAIGNAGNLVLYVFNTIDFTEAYSVVGGVDIIGSPVGKGVAGWGFSPDRRDRTFVHAIMTGIDNYGVCTYTLIVKNLETGEDVFRAPGCTGGASFRFSPSGDYFLWIHSPSLDNVICKFYKTGNPDIGHYEQGSGIDLLNVFTLDDGHYIKYSNGSVYIFNNTSDRDCDDTSPPEWPGGSSLSLSNNTGTTIDLSWPAAGDSKGSILYSVLVNGESMIVLEDATSYQLTGLIPNNTYDSFEVIAGDESGNWTADGLKVENVLMNNDEEPVWAGATLDQVSATGTTLKLGWNPASDDNGIIYYRIHQTDGPTFTISGDSTNTTIKDLISEHIYTFNIEAGDAADQWVNGAQLIVTMPVDPRPTWPAGSSITVDETTETSVIFSWNPADDVFGVTKYRIDRDGEVLGSTYSNLRQYEDVNLEQGETYTFAIYAGDESGNWSDALEKEITTIPAFTELPLVVAPGIQKMPDIDGNIIVWQDDRNGNKDIYEYQLELEKEIALVTNVELQTNPAVSGERIVWEDARNHSESESDIYIHYPWQGDIAVCDESGFQASPEISGTYVTWSDLRGDDYDIYLFNLITLEEKVICSASGRQAFPSISGHLVVWEDYRNGDADIYGYNIYEDEVFEICKESGDQTRPVVDVINVRDYRIVWIDDRGSDLDIYMYAAYYYADLTMKLNLGYGSNQTSPHLKDDQLVYMDDKNGSWDIYAYQFNNMYYGDIIPVCLEDGDQIAPRTSNGRVVWEDHRNDDGDIYIYDRPPGTDLSLSLLERTDPIPTGRTLIYEITAINDGPENEMSAFVECLLPLNAMLDNTSANKGIVSEEGLSLRWDIGPLKNDSSAILKIYLKTFEIGDLNFKAEISGSGFDPDPSNNTIDEITEVKFVVSEALGYGEHPSLLAEGYGKVHAVYGSPDSVVYITKVPDGIWHSELLDTVNGFNDSDILMDNNDNIHILYSDRIYDQRPKSRLFYLNNTNSGLWENKIISLSDSGFSSISSDVSAGNNLHMLFQQSPGSAFSAPFKYTNKVSGAWNYPEMFYPGGYDHIDMVLDKEGLAHTCYIGINIGPIYRKSQDTLIDIWYQEEIIEDDWRGGQLEGMVVDIDVDSNNNPHIVYPGSTNDDGNENIKYARKVGLSWKVEEVDKGSTGSGANAILVEDGSVHVAYMHALSNDLRYATNVAGPWIKQTIEKDAAGWLHSLDIAKDDYGNVHMVFEKDGMVNYALRPAIEYFTVNHDTLDFGLIKIDSSKTIQLLLSNEMTNRIRIDSITVLDKDGFSFNKTNFILHKGIKDSVAITFAPEEILLVSSYLRIYFTSNSKLFMDIPVLARTPAPGLAVDPDPVDFDVVTPYTQELKTVSILNDGEVDLEISDIDVKYEMWGYVLPTDFSLISHTCDILAPAESCEVEISFYPKKTGSQISFLNIMSNDALNPYKQVRLSGDGQYPRAVILTSDYKIDFEYVDINQSATQSILIQSAGDINLDISNITLSGVDADQFSFSHSCTSIPPGESCLLEVTFNPTIADDCTASINIFSNSVYTSTKVINLTGTAVQRNLTVSEASIDFGNLIVGEESLRVVTLSNNETSDITVSNTTILGRDYLEFLHKGFTGTILSGESVVDSIWLSPVTDGDKEAKYIITSNDSDGETIDIILSGEAEEGVAPLQANIQASQLSGSVPLEIDFSLNVTGGMPPYTFNWTFGDGGSSINQNPVHTFTDVGIYDVLVTITGSDHSSINKGITVTVAEVVYSLSGNTFEDDGFSGITKGFAALFRKGNSDYEQFLAINGINSFTFNNLTEDEYSVRYFPDPDEYPDFLPTYLGDVLNLYEAEYVMVNSNVSGQDINMITKPGEGSGEGTINGKVVEGSGKGNTVVSIGGTKAGATSMEGILVYLLNNTTGHLEGYDITDEQGYFEFANLANSEYKFMVDYKGLPMDPANPLLVLTQAADSISILATVSGIEISASILATNVNEANHRYGMVVYPNPASEVVYLEASGRELEDIRRVSLLGLRGNVIISRNDLMINQENAEISLRGIKSGVYLLRIETKTNCYNKRIVIIE